MLVDIRPVDGSLMPTQVRRMRRPRCPLLNHVATACQDSGSCLANKQRRAGFLSLLEPEQCSLHSCSHTHSPKLPMQAPALGCYAASTFMIACTS